MAILITDNKVDPDYSYSAVPEHARMNKSSLTMTWWSLCSAMIWLLISATLAVNYGSANTLIGLVLSVIMYGVVNGIVSRFAIKTGLSVGLFSRMAWVIPSLTGVFLMNSSIWLSQYAAIVTMILSFSIYYFSLSCFRERTVVV
ncbi:hypothetical protein NO559_07675 [Dasania sp. GY-MA-18]|uniref:Uncharacterized protein n=1 Tax=Dasania phycosphaerae TaxID=2950436 RepID=A0A9J6RKP9_9GAMM|nr:MULTISPECIES: hypothetical protein [Dasania]MCR8922645.1 hypothetical protein [Dasania sp. GY-MA-18]MCZ0865075.1 hypothetical protein [Dasania phycosphaerae]MCZ0868801.1 hypothetical protein [Dasania phycosphaerae]